MISAARCAELCVGLYDPVKPPSFRHVDFGLGGGVCWAVATEGDADVVILRGSTTVGDWLRDFDVVAAPYASRRLGPLHHGFYLGMDNAWSDMKEVLRPDVPVVLTGHSLGAARAAILTGYMILDGRPPVERVVFGEPKAGFQQLADAIASVPSRSYCNGDDANHDLVTELPFTLPLLRYVHPRPLIHVNASPDPGDNSGIFVYHHMDLYLKAVAALEAP